MSLGTLDRRLAHFCIKFINYDADIDEVEAAVREETNGPGQLLGYRAMHRKIREQHNLAVPRDLVYDMMTLVDPEGQERRGNVGKRKRHRGPTGSLRHRQSSIPRRVYATRAESRLRFCIN